MRKTIDEKSKKENRTRSRLPSFTADEIAFVRGEHFSRLLIIILKTCHIGVNFGRNVRFFCTQPLLNAIMFTDAGFSSRYSYVLSRHKREARARPDLANGQAQLAPRK